MARKGNSKRQHANTPTISGISPQQSALKAINTHLQRTTKGRTAHRVCHLPSWTMTSPAPEQHRKAFKC